MEVLNPEYLNTFKLECEKLSHFLSNYSYENTAHYNYNKDSFMITHSITYTHYFKKLELNISYIEFPSRRQEDNQEWFSLNFNIRSNINEPKTFYLSTYLTDHHLDKTIKTFIHPDEDFNQTIRDFFQHARRLLANELKETLLGNEVHDHAERAMQSYIDHIYDSPTLANNLYQKQIDDYRKKMSLYDRFIEWNSRLIANLEIRFFRLITPFLRFLKSLFEDKK